MLTVVVFGMGDISKILQYLSLYIYIYIYLYILVTKKVKNLPANAGKNN